MDNSRKQRIDGVTFVRAVCTLTIVLYHSSGFLSYEPIEQTELFMRLASSAWGNISVTAFFILSGAALSYNYSGKLKVATFYRKRWMSIFPPFYLTYFVIYIVFASRAKNLLYGGNPVQLLLTLIGCDGYFGSPYYLTGEWFLGAIIILYLLFPLLKLLMDKCRWITSAGILILYFTNIKYVILGENTFRSIITCVVSFWVGMLVANELEYIAKNTLIFVVSIDVFWHLYTGKIALGPETWSVLTGAAVFFILLTSGQYAMTNKYVSMAAKYLSKISFQIFLVHHFIINEFASLMQRFTLPNSEIVRWSLFAGIVWIIIVVASLLDYVVSLLIRLASTHCFARSA